MRTGQIFKQLDGVVLALAGDKLQVSGPPARVTELAPLIREHKSALVAELSRPGFKWCRENHKALLALGWTVEELYHPTLPRGLALLDLWDRDLEVEMVGAAVRFKWQRADGSTVEQTGRPDAMVATPTGAASILKPKAPF